MDGRVISELRDIAIVRKREGHLLTRYELGRRCDDLAHAIPRTFEVDILECTARGYSTLVVRRGNRRVRVRVETIFLSLPIKTFSKYALEPLMPAFHDLSGNEVLQHHA